MALKDPKARTAGALASLQVQETLVLFLCIGQVGFQSDSDKMFLVSRWNPVIQSIWENSCTLSKQHNILMSISWAYEWNIVKSYQTPITGWMPVPFCGRCHVRCHMGWWYYNPILEKRPCPAGFSENHGYINLIQQKMWKTNGLSTNSVYIYIYVRFWLEER